MNIEFFQQFDCQLFAGNAASEDKRRTIREVDMPEFCVQHFTVHIGSLPLGNHFHMVAETFRFVKGTGTIYLMPIVNGVPDQSRRQKIVVSPGFLLVIPASTAHRFDMIKKAEFYCYSPTDFKSKWAGTVTYEITPW